MKWEKKREDNSPFVVSVWGSGGENSPSPVFWAVFTKD